MSIVPSESTLIEWVDPATLRRHPKNQEIYGDDLVDDLVVSINDHGILEPLFVSTTDHTVISGDRCRRAALVLGLPVVPVVWATYPNDLAEHRAIVEHNRHRKKNGQQLAQEGRLLEKIYAEEARQKQLAQGERGKEGGRGNKKTLQELLPEGFRPQTRDRVAMAIGLGSGRQWDKLSYVAERAESGDQEAMRVLPLIPVTVSIDAAYKQVRSQEERKQLMARISSVAHGQVLPSGRVMHRQPGLILICGDATDMCELENDSVDLVVTDPPFNLGVNYGASINDNMPPEQYAAWTRDWILESLRVLKPGGQLFALMPLISMARWLPEIRGLMERHRGHLLSWCKTMAHLHRENTWIRAWEPVLWMAKGGTPAVFHRSYQFENDKDWIIGANAMGEAKGLPLIKLHPTPRPTWLYRDWILMASEPGMLVLDPFLGSGTGAAVAQNLGRKFVGYDLNEAWVHLSAERVRVEDGKVGNSPFRQEDLKKQL